MSEPTKKPLRFKVASHIVEDLGLNLYTSLPRVLVEFVANAYDADASKVHITIDHEKIKRHRKAVKAEFERQRALAHDEDEEEIEPLGLRALPDGISILIKDDGIGMSRDDLSSKFLVAGRRRRMEEDRTTDKGRVIMGRKGLGKLAGFGVAKRLCITTCPASTTRATKIVLDYDDLVRSRTTDSIVIPEEEVDGTEILPDGGTVIELQKLLYDPMKSREATIASRIADHFHLIDPGDFRILVNSQAVKPTPRYFRFAWPSPEKPVEELEAKVLPLSGDLEGESVRFRYRMRFSTKSLRAAERGVRVYANKRLAASPSLLDAETGMHGFRMSDYLDGVVHADFVDEQPTDYISTDRHGLRWDAPMLSDLRRFLSAEIKTACSKYQAVRDKDAEKEVEEDEFTQQEIGKVDLSTRERKLALKVAKALSSAYGVDDNAYKTSLPPIVAAIGHGGIVTAISKMAEEDNPLLAPMPFT